jgi:ornithine cyclodeaminase/alanine dehydrogenase-like protein (mu-crystallin family)
MLAKGEMEADARRITVFKSVGIGALDAAAANMLSAHHVQG